MRKSKMADKLGVRIEYKCLDDDTTGHIRINISSWKNKQVKDLKSVIQDELNAPSCDQKVLYKGFLLCNDSLSLTSLYLREGDLIQVEFLATADIPGMKELINNLKAFAQRIGDNNVEHDELLKISEQSNTSTLLKYDLVIRALENLAFVFFLPWKKGNSVAQRHYFVQEGGFNAFLVVFAFSHKRFSVPVNKTNWFRDKTDECAFDRQTHYNNEQMMLQMHCLSLLWNFSETSEDRKFALRVGSLQMVLNALLLDPHIKTPEEDEFWVIASLNETAVGCVVQYAEFTGTQEVISNSQETVNKLIYMVECRLSRMTTFYTLYSSQIAANTLFCCSCSLKTPSILVRNGVHLRMITLTKTLLDNDHDLALRYYCSLFLARIMCCSTITLGMDTIKEIDQLLGRFIDKHKPEEISSWEEKHNYVWVTMVPFVGMAFAGGPYTRLVPQHKESTKNCGNVTNTAERELVSGYVTNADESDKLGEFATQNTTASHTLTSSRNGQTEDSWQNQYTCSANTMQSGWPGSAATQRIGLFCLQHMMRQSENCLLVKKENLSVYLTCLSWHLHELEKKKLEEVLQKVQSHEPPSLVVIAKAALAVMRGFENALHM